MRFSTVLAALVLTMSVSSSEAASALREAGSKAAFQWIRAKGKLRTPEEMAEHRTKLRQKSKAFGPKIQAGVEQTIAAAEKGATLKVGRLGGRIGKAPPPEGGTTGWATTSSVNGLTTVEAGLDEHGPARAGGGYGSLLATGHYKAEIRGGKWLGHAKVELDGGRRVVTETRILGLTIGGKRARDKQFGVD